MQKDSFKIRISWLSISIVLIMLYAYSTSFWKYIYFTNFVRNLSLYVVMMVMGLILLKTNFKRMTRASLLIILALFFVMINNKDIQNGDIYYFRGILTMVLFLLVPKKNDRWVAVGKKFIVYATLFFAVFTIWFYFDVDFYRDNILPIFDESSQRQLLYSLNRGASAGLTKNYSINGTFLAEGILAIFGIYLFQGKKKRKIGVVLAIISVFALLLTGKRAHIVFLGAVFIAGYYFYNSDKKKGRLFKIIAIISAILIAFIIVAQFVPSVMLFYDRFIETVNSGDITMGRIEYYAIALQQFKANPILGIGWGGFKYVNSAYTGFANGTYTNAHNMYLQLLCETGILGFLLFMILIVGVLIKSVRLLKKAKKHGKIEASQRLLYAFMLQLFVVLYGITGNPIYDLETMAFYIFACAITLYYDLENKHGIYMSV